MSRKSSTPYQRLSLQVVEQLVEVAGFAPACAYESSDQWHQVAVTVWKRRNRRNRLSQVSPSLASLCLAVALIVM